MSSDEQQGGHRCLAADETEYVVTTPIVIKRLNKGCTNLMYECEMDKSVDIAGGRHKSAQQYLQRDHRNMNAMHYCTKKRNLLTAAQIASTAPELLDSPDDDGLTPLHLAVIQGNMELLRWLLAGKANVNALDNECHSVVHWATVCGEVEALRAVLAAGANIATADIHGGSPLHYAAQMCGVTSVMSCPKTYAAVAFDILTIILKHPETRVSAVDMDKRQPLLWASSAGSAKAILALVHAGAKVESYDKDGLTAIHCAASRGHTECIDTLINLCGSPTDLTDKNGCTALHYAVALGHIDCVALLLDMQANPNHQDLKGRTPAHCGCAKGQLETVRILGERGKANLWLQNAKGDLPVHDAAVSGRRELVAWLLKQKPDQANVSSNDGRTLLHIAAENNYTDMCKMLLDAGADINSIYQTSDNIVLTPLDCSLTRSFRSTAKFLQFHGGLPASKLRISSQSSTKTIAGHEMEPDAQPKRSISKSKLESKEPKECSTSKKVVIYVDDTNSDSDDGKPSRGSDLNKMISKMEHKRRKRKTANMNRRYKTKSFNIYLRRNSSSDESKSNNCSSKDEACASEMKPEEHVLIQAKDVLKTDTPTVKQDISIENSKTQGSDDKIETKTASNNDAQTTQKTDTKIEAKDASKANETADKPSSEIKSNISITEEVADVKSDKAEKYNTEPCCETPDPTKQEVHAKETYKDDKVQETNVEPNLENKCASDFKPSEIEHTAKDDDNKNKSETDTQIEKDSVDNVAKNKSNQPDNERKPEPQKVEFTDEPSPVSMIENAEEIPINANKHVTIAEVHSTPDSIPDGTVEESKQTDKSNPGIEKENADSQQPEPDKITPDTIDGDKDVGKDGDKDVNKDGDHIPQPTPDPTTVRKTSFTVLDNLEDGIEPSFEVIPHKSNDYSETHDQTSSADEDDEPLNVRSFSAGQLPKVDRPKRVQMRVASTKYTSHDQQFSSKEMDSGIEPSPRANMSSPQSTSSVDKSKRLPPKRWTGGNAHRKECKQTNIRKETNMSMVALSLQEDINRYYMERQLFQHLLELKSLQIRSSKVLESALVKRAVDDYHNSTLFPKNECVTASQSGEVKRTLATKDSDPTYLRRYPYKEYTFKKFELHLYETLKSLQKNGSRNFQNISEVYREAERRNVLDKRSVASALRCTTKTHRCLHAAHAYTGIPCAAYIPMMNHHTMPKPGFMPTKTRDMSSFYLPEITTLNSKAAAGESSATRNSKSGVSVEVSHGLSRKSIYLPTNKLDRNKRYYVTLSVKDVDRAE